MEIMGSIGILLVIAAFIYFVFKGYSILVVAPLSAAAIILFNKMSFTTAMFSGSTSFAGGIGNFVTKFFRIFVRGAIRGKCVEDSGAAMAIAASVLKLTGKDNPYAILLAVAAIGAILTYGGVSVFIVIFTVVALARPLFKSLNIPWHLLLASMVLGCATFTLCMLPGTPSVQNIIPTAALKTTLTAAPVVGIVSAIVTIIFGLIYIKWQLNVAKAKGEVYEASGPQNPAGSPDRDLPSLAIALTPMVILIAIIFIGSAMKVSNIIIPALLAAIVVSMVLFNKYIPKQLAVLNSGAANAIGPVLFTAAAVGVGSVITAAPGFKAILSVLTSTPGGPMVEVAVISGFMAAVTGSATGAIGIVMATFSEAWLATGLPPEVIHRIAGISACALSNVPQNGVIFALMGITGLTYKDCFKHIFWIGLVGGILSLIAAIITAGIIY
jgi:H+/gluconate symporter-like permease